MRGGHGGVYKFFHKIGHALATVGKDVDHYALGDFFKQAVDGFKEEYQGVGDIFKHITKAKGWKELGEGIADHVGDALEVADPMAGTVANQFAHSMVHGQGFDQALENAGMALAGGAVGEAGARIGGKLMTKFGESEAGRALKGAIGKVMKRNPEKFSGISLGGDEGVEMKGLSGEGGQDGGDLDEEDLDLQRRFDALRNSDRETPPVVETPGMTRLTPDVLNPQASTSRGVTDPATSRLKSRTRPKGSKISIAKRGLEPSAEFTGDFEGPYKDESGKAFRMGPEFDDGLRYDMAVENPRMPYRLRQAKQALRNAKVQAGRMGRSGLRTVGKATSGVRRSGLYKGAKREAYNLGKSLYRGIPKTLKEEGGRYLVERALRPLEGGEHFDMMHDGGSTGLGGDNPCPPGQVMRDGVCVPMK